jgi:predicted glycogen debranching enzyme
MLTLRDFHSLFKKDQSGKFTTEITENDVQITAEGGATITMQCQADGARFECERDWWYGIHYNRDTERGQDDHEDNFVPGFFEVDLATDRDHVVTVTVALGKEAADPQTSSIEARKEHLGPIFEAFKSQKASGEAKCWVDDSMRRILAIAADDFVTKRTIRGNELSTIMAGYPWFADWGRDTFIALPGLLLATGRHEEARDTLRVFAESIQDGLVPNRFDDYDDSAAHYNTVDASLWFVRAAMQYVKMTKDGESWGEWLAPAANSVIDAYIKGTQYDIKMGGDCLIGAGNHDTQLTWMDAAATGPDGNRVVFTPRHGKAVEINALWYDILLGMAELIGDTDRRTAEHYKKLGARIKRAYAKLFWNDDHNCLNDHAWTDDNGETHIDTSIRPNQIFAASVERSPIPLTRQRQVVDAVRLHLATPFGLRTLSEFDPNYHAYYTGPAFQRDEAYHQGTVWPWLIGPFAEAILRSGKFSVAAKREARAAITPMLQRLATGGLGQLNEIHESAEPHRPVGAIAQAWSVSEVIRVLYLIESG